MTGVTLTTSFNFFLCTGFVLTAYVYTKTVIMQKKKTFISVTEIYILKSLLRGYQRKYRNLRTLIIQQRCSEGLYKFQLSGVIC